MQVTSVNVSRIPCYSYDKYIGTVIFLTDNYRYISVEIEDISCGEMGFRDTVTLQLNDFKISYTTGSMKNGSIMADDKVLSLLRKFSIYSQNDAYALVCKASEIIKVVFHSFIAG